MRNKVKDMIRSILPSTYGGAVRDKALLKRTVRRSVRVDVRRDDLETAPIDLGREAYVQPVVWHRRAADKLNHFMRWCEAMTKGMTREEKLGAIKGLLPKSLIGQHAYGHWKRHCEPRRGFTRYRTWAQRLQSMTDSLRFRLRRALENDPTLLGRLNAAIKRRKDPLMPRRMLHGIHDVDAFAEDVVHGPYATEYDTSIQLIEAIEGGREAALDVCGGVTLAPFFRNGRHAYRPIHRCRRPVRRLTNPCPTCHHARVGQPQQ